MKCTVSKKDLTRIIDRCKGATDTKHETEATHCILLRANEGMLSAFATDLKLSIYTEVQCAVEKPGACSVNVEKIRNAVRAMPDGMITLKVDPAKHSTTVSCSGQRKYSMSGLNPEHHHTREAPPGQLEWYTLSSKICKEAITRTKDSSANEPGRPYLEGILFEFGPKLFKAVAMGGYSLSYYEHNGDFDHPEGACFIPNSLLPSIIASTEDVSFAYTDRAVFVNTGVDRMSALLPHTPYPNWQLIRDSGSKLKQCKFDVQQLIQAVRGVTAVSKGDVQIKLVDSTLLLSLVNVKDSEGEDAVPVTAEPDAGFTSTLNPSHLLNVLDGAEKGIGELFVDRQDAMSPVSIRGDDGFFGLVVPLSGKR